MPHDYSEDNLIQKSTVLLMEQELPESYPEESMGFYRDQVYNFLSQRYNGYA